MDVVRLLDVTGQGLKPLLSAIHSCFPDFRHCLRCCRLSRCSDRRACVIFRVTSGFFVDEIVVVFLGVISRISPYVRTRCPSRLALHCGCLYRVLNSHCTGGTNALYIILDRELSNIKHCFCANPHHAVRTGYTLHHVIQIGCIRSSIFA